MFRLLSGVAALLLYAACSDFGSSDPSDGGAGPEAGADGSVSGDGGAGAREGGGLDGAATSFCASQTSAAFCADMETTATSKWYESGSGQGCSLEMPASGAGGGFAAVVTCGPIDPGNARLVASVVSPSVAPHVHVELDFQLTLPPLVGMGTFDLFGFYQNAGPGLRVTGTATQWAILNAIPAGQGAAITPPPLDVPTHATFDIALAAPQSVKISWDSVIAYDGPLKTSNGDTTTLVTFGIIPTWANLNEPMNAKLIVDNVTISFPR